jgi:hypothetical protein
MNPRLGIESMMNYLSALLVSNNGTLDSDVVDPNYTNIYAPYKLQTPSKMTGSLAYVLAKQD